MNSCKFWWIGIKSLRINADKDLSRRALGRLLGPSRLWSKSWNFPCLKYAPKFYTLRAWRSTLHRWANSSFLQINFLGMVIYLGSLCYIRDLSNTKVLFHKRKPGKIGPSLWRTSFWFWWLLEGERKDFAGKLLIFSLIYPSFSLAFETFFENVYRPFFSFIFTI